MSRYIDADALIVDLIERYCKECNKRKGYSGKFIYEIGEAPCRACELDDEKVELEDAPTADVVEVVRCKDCKYMPTGDGANHDLEFPEDFKCPCQCDDFWYSWKPNDNWFCGNGKRRDDG